MKLLYLLCLSAIAAYSLACATTPARTNTARPLLVASTEYPAVGRFLYRGVQHCSGTLIGPRLVLTAAHCVGFLSTSGEPFSFQTPLDATPIDIEWVQSFGEEGGLNDVALAKLQTTSVATPMELGMERPGAGRFIKVGYGHRTRHTQKFLLDVYSPGVILHSRGLFVIPGDSGGALIDAVTKEVVGVVSAYSRGGGSVFADPTQPNIFALARAVNVGLL